MDTKGWFNLLYFKTSKDLSESKQSLKILFIFILRKQFFRFTFLNSSFE